MTHCVPQKHAELAFCITVVPRPSSRRRGIVFSRLCL